MKLAEFLDAWVGVEELKDLLYMFDLPRTGQKDLLISRLVGAPEISPAEVLCALRNETLQAPLRRHELSPSGRKPDLVARLIERDVVSFDPDELLSFLEKLDRDEFGSYSRLLLLAKSPNLVPRVVRLLGKASEDDLQSFSQVIRRAPPERAAEALVGLLATGEEDVPCFAAFLLEELMEAGGTATPVVSAFDKEGDRLTARQRTIKSSCEKHPEHRHPAVDSLLQRIWSGSARQTEAFVTEVRSELRSGARSLESKVESLRDQSEARTLEDVRRRTARIEDTTKDIHRGVRSLEEQLRAIEKSIEDSPERVARSLGELSESKSVKWGTRRRIKHDLRRFWLITDYAQKVEFLARVISRYGPVVVSALKGLL